MKNLETNFKNEALESSKNFTATSSQEARRLVEKRGTEYPVTIIPWLGESSGAPQYVAENSDELEEFVNQALTIASGEKRVHIITANALTKKMPSGKIENPVD
ncbi:hypothetical protein JXR01_02220 [Candidatus Kaiserbacteria bacterium]|nr:MAG: hypothetical protein JXR01_02220 [Candidatus Kaiserbacteria bacterium]